MSSIESELGIIRCTYIQQGLGMEGKNSFVHWPRGRTTHYHIHLEHNKEKSSKTLSTTGYRCMIFKVPLLVHFSLPTSTICSRSFILSHRAMD